MTKFSVTKRNIASQSRDELTRHKSAKKFWFLRILGQCFQGASSHANR